MIDQSYPSWPEMFRWLTVLKDRVETLPSISAEQVLTGTLDPSLIPPIPWALVLKAGSSLGDLETRSAGDLSSGTLLGARMPALTGDISSVVGAVATTLATVNTSPGTYGSGTAIPLITVNGKGLVTNVMEQPIQTGALTRVNDTNVTATLTGTPLTALLKDVTITLGWAGTLAVARGGTGTGTAFTAGSVVFAGASGVYAQNNANFFWDSAAGLGIGTATPFSRLHVQNAAGIVQVLRLANNDYNPFTNTGTFLQLATGAASGDTFFAISNWGGGGTVSTPLILQRFGSGVGIGRTTISALLHLAAGTATASTAPLKLTTGALLTTAEAGAVEFLTDAFYGTITTGAARKTFAFLEAPAFTGAVTFAADVTIHGLTVGLGLASVARNTAVAVSGLAAITIGNDNVAVGYQSLMLLTSGGSNTVVGSNAGANLTTTGSNTFIGGSAGFKNVGSRNVAVGQNAMICNTVGATGTDNVAVGQNALLAITTGQQNSGLGTNAGNSVTSGTSNVVLGYNCGTGLTTTSYNVFIGRTAGQNATGASGIFIGSGIGGTNGAGFQSTGAQNIFIGPGAGNAVTSGDYNIIIGAYTGSVVDTNSNRIVISDGQGNIYAYADNNKSWALGGGTSPTAKLHLPAGTATASTAPLKLTSGTVLTSAEAGAIEFTTDDFFATITTGAARKAFILDNGSRLTSGKVPVATTNGRLIDGPTLGAAGLKIPAIQASARATAQVAAIASIATFTLSAADGDVVIAANVNVTTSVLHSFSVQVDYTDETNTAQTETLTFTQLSAASVSVITNGTGAGPYMGVVVTLRCKASTAVTAKTTGTFTSVAYNVGVTMVQLA